MSPALSLAMSLAVPVYLECPTSPSPSPIQPNSKTAHSTRAFATVAGARTRSSLLFLVRHLSLPPLQSQLTPLNAADGGFNLMTFSLGGPSKPSLTSDPLLTLLPLAIRSSRTTGTSGTAISISLTSRAPPSRPLTNLVLRLPLGKGANGMNATVSGGGYPKDSSGKSVGGGAGRWEVESESEGQVLVWRIAELVSTDRPAVLQGQYFR